MASIHPHSEVPGEGRAASGNAEAASASHNISESTFERVRDLIVHGKLAPGSRVIEADLAERLGVSRTPIRSALHRLRQEGYIVVSAGSGNKARLSVAPLTHDDARELYLILGRLEGMAARSIPLLEPRAQAELLDKLRRSNQGLREMAESKVADPGLTFDLDMSFHQAIVDSGAGPRLRAIYGTIKPQTERYCRLYASAIVEQLGVSVDEHVDIIRCFETGNCQEVERAIQQNWENGAERLCRVIATLGERGSW
jgi:DNA-binding GntR family transcriptional regulator